jgi:hypothetical protein
MNTYRYKRRNKDRNKDSDMATNSWQLAQTAFYPVWADAL